MPTVCPPPAGTCPIGTTFPSSIVYVNGTLWPSRYDADHGIDKLSDSSTTYALSAWATSAVRNYLQVELEAPVDDVDHVSGYGHDDGDGHNDDDQAKQACLSPL